MEKQTINRALERLILNEMSYDQDEYSKTKTNLEKYINGLMKLSDTIEKAISFAKLLNHSDCLKDISKVLNDNVMWSDGTLNDTFLSQIDDIDKYSSKICNYLEKYMDIDGYEKSWNEIADKNPQLNAIYGNLISSIN